jgi:hypothetical protein
LARRLAEHKSGNTKSAQVIGSFKMVLEKYEEKLDDFKRNLALIGRE